MFYSQISAAKIVISFGLDTFCVRKIELRRKVEDLSSVRGSVAGVGEALDDVVCRHNTELTGLAQVFDTLFVIA